MSMRTITAVIVTTGPSDVVDGIAIAMPLRQAGIPVETPLAHSQEKRQRRRAMLSGARIVLVLDGGAVEMVDTLRGTKTALGMKDAVTASLAIHEEHRLARARGAAAMTISRRLPMAA